MTKYKPGKELREERGIRNFEFFNNYIKRGLQPYNNLGKPVSPPDVELKISSIEKNLKDAEEELDWERFLRSPEGQEHKRALQKQKRDFEEYNAIYWNGRSSRTSRSSDDDEVVEIKKDLLEIEKRVETLKKELSSIDYSWKDYSLPKSEKKVEKILNALDGYLYKVEEVEKVKNEQQGRSIQTTPAPQSLTHPQYAFYKTGETWKIIFDGEELPPLKQGGFKYFHYCMVHDDQEFSNLKLDNSVNPRPKGSEARIGSEEGFTVGDPKAIITRQQKLDYPAVQNLRNHLAQLNRDIEIAEPNNDPGLMDKLQSEKDKIEDQLAEATGLFRDDAQRSSDKIGQAMKRALEELTRHSEDAYNHFRKAFSPIHSNLKRYRPTNPISWDLEKK